jgi:hypothetical protein
MTTTYGTYSILLLLSTLVRIIRDKTRYYYATILQFDVVVVNAKLMHSSAVPVGSVAVSSSHVDARSSAMIAFVRWILVAETVGNGAASVSKVS